MGAFALISRLRDKFNILIPATVPNKNKFLFRDIRRYFEEIKQEQWQRLDSKEVLSSCDKHNDSLHSLPKIVRLWDVYTFTDEEIKRTKVSLRFIFSSVLLRSK
jgi:hypothetical protein